MRARRRVLLVAVTAVAILVAAAFPAGAMEPFGSIVTVAQPPPGCTIGIVNGDATQGSGAILGFANFIGPGCAADDVWYVASAGAAGKKQLSPYHGQVLASSQNGVATYVLIANGSGIFLGKRLTGNGAYVAAQQLSPTTPGAVSPQGDVIAGDNDTWWAVWTEQVGPGGEFAQTELFQAKTVGGNLGRTQVTNNPDNDSQPALAFKPGGGGALAFIRDNAFGDEPTHSNLRLAQASGAPGCGAASSSPPSVSTPTPASTPPRAPAATSTWPGCATGRCSRPTTSREPSSTRRSCPTPARPASPGRTARPMWPGRRSATAR